MFEFVLLAALLTAVVLAVLLWPLRPNAKASALTLAELNRSVYRDQLAELERDLARGQIAETNYQEARDELQRRLLQDVPDADLAVPLARPRRTAWTALALVILLPLGGAALYAKLGSVPVLNGAAVAAQEQTPEEIERIVAKLASALAESPNNPQGWILLGRAYTKMGRIPEAASAYEHANAFIATSPDLLVEQADVLIAAAGDDLSGRPMDLVRQALALEPRHPMALMLMGMSAYRQGQHAEAISHWQTLLEVLPAGSPEAQAVQANIAQAQSEAGLPPATSATSATSATPAAPAAPSAPAVTEGISGEVTVSETLRSELKPGDQLFIVVRANDGSRAPVAVLRQTVENWPVKFRLDDSHAMLADRSLSKIKADLSVIARISRSGQPVSQPGDLESDPIPVARGAMGLNLVISKKL